MNSSIRKHRYYPVIIWIAFAGCIYAIYFLVSSYYEYLIPYGDSVQYWAAGKLLLNGFNPYSPDQVIHLRQIVGSSTEFPPNAISMMLYPPWSLPFIIPFGIFSYPLSRLYWLISNIFIIFICVRILWILYNEDKNYLFLALIIAFTFAPTLYVLGMGHITTLHLLGIVGFLYWIQKPKSNNWHNFLAGASISLVLIKPQLQYLLLIAILFWVIERRKWFVAIGGFVALAGLTTTSILINPDVLYQYWQSLSNYSPILIGLTWITIHWQKQKKFWDWVVEMPMLLLVGVITSPYIWTYDMVVLVVPLIAILQKINQTRINWQLAILILVYLLVNFSTYYLHRYFPDNWFFWFAPTMLVLYLIGMRLIHRQGTTPPNLKFESLSDNY
ncbi:MAG: glycosyltransferase family 87 protein [Candidatus Kariarchaeaceae archaeon]|jgi:hypothetical protein